MSSNETFGEVNDVDHKVTVQNAWLRETLAETIVRRHVGHHHPNDDIPIPRRFGFVRHRWGFSLPKRGAWFPVTCHEVDAARLRAFRAGVTFPTYMYFHLLRRNYEADLTVQLGGMWLKIQRDPPPRLRRELALFWTNTGFSLIGFIDELDRMATKEGTEPCEIRIEIRLMIADMCRPLKPRSKQQRGDSSSR